MTQTTATLSVRTYSIARDMWEAGDCAECAACGRNIRHVTEINGATYGTRCAEALLATTEAVVIEVKPAVVNGSLTVEAIDAKVTNAFHKTILYQDWVNQEKTAAAVFFKNDMNIVCRQLHRTSAELTQAAIARQGQEIAAGYIILAEVKKFMERGR